MRPIRIPLEPAGRSPPRSRVPVETPRLRPTSPTRSRVAHLLSSGQNISASLEAISRHKGQTALPLTRLSYEGIKGQPLRHGTQDKRRQAAIPTVDVTGVPSTDSGHRSAIPDAVAALWDLRRGTRQARHCSRYFSAYTDHPDPPPTGEGVRRRHVSFREGRSAHTDEVPDLPPLGVRDLHVSPGPSSVHARTPTRVSGAVARHHYHGHMQDPNP